MAEMGWMGSKILKAYRQRIGIIIQGGTGQAVLLILNDLYRFGNDLDLAGQLFVKEPLMTVFKILSRIADMACGIKAKNMMLVTAVMMPVFTVR